MRSTNKERFLSYVLEDVLGHLKGITHRAMFGGYGIYKNGVIFALIAYNKLYFKVGEKNIEEYQALKSKPFQYAQGDHRATTMSYWLVPDLIQKDPKKISEWVRKSVAVSKAGKKST
ncbi:competence protein TfoX [Candidatus Uhrbacteria bacterium]|nr:competence protein TfoX [Candidatus Uhrbacteria bacterium]MBD3284251.1 competence protein TfoX [Candidatus Uhrbacteria bacterium]